MNEALEEPPDTEHGDSGADHVTLAQVDERENHSDVRVVDRRWWARSQDSDTGQPERSGKPSYVEGLEKELADKDKLLKEYAAKYKAATNEFDQTRERLRREVTKDIDREKRKVLITFLEVLDNLDRAIEASRDASTDNPGVLNLLKGVKMVRQQFLTTLQSYGVERIEASGELFDPNFHDALSTVLVNEADRENVVIDIVKPGYQVNDEVLRPATVTVGKLAPRSE